jgi:hypothetical protein
LAGVPDLCRGYYQIEMKGKTRIVIKGHLDKQWTNHFEGMEISYEAGSTVLSGTLKDDSHLHGILEIIRNLNLSLISVNPVEDLNPRNESFFKTSE